MVGDMLEVQRRPITVEEFYRMGEAGIFDRDERVEMIDGELIVPPQLGPRHAGAIARITELLVRRLAGRASVRCQIPLPMLPKSEPSPDFTIAVRDQHHYVDRHP